MTPGIHLVHKPVGPTSFSIVQEAIAQTQSLPERRRPKICHGGTLDPFAEGLLLLLSGQATKLFDHLHAIPKTYEATIRWGVETDNGDPTGRIVRQADASLLSPAQLDDAIRSFIGWREQIPPTTSNKRVAGERAYAKAHRGETFDLPPSRVYLHEATWLEHDLPAQTSRLRVVVKGGYYVRALVRDLGRAVGCGGHVAALRRTAIGPWNDPPVDQRVELTGRGLLPWARSRVLTDQEIGELRAKRPIALGPIEPPDWTLPDGFPDPDAPIRGFHLGRLAFLLRENEGRLDVLTELARGL